MYLDKDNYPFTLSEEVFLIGGLEPSLPLIGDEKR